eukprot:TRINITY_DN9929_c0_g1_i1.p1 TRINITY_DN9929_c0_g1~~TRINITY_DN9929_c0_g1_i1.p1  ORF type:complete len:922 (+),score=118.86 TRINITY_DN9929_c0_g1_i1:270-2768(+)
MADTIRSRSREGELLTMTVNTTTDLSVALQHEQGLIVASLSEMTSAGSELSTRASRQNASLTTLMSAFDANVTWQLQALTDASDELSSGLQRTLSTLDRVQQQSEAETHNEIAALESIVASSEIATIAAEEAQTSSMQRIQQEATSLKTNLDHALAITRGNASVLSNSLDPMNQSTMQSLVAYSVEADSILRQASDRVAAFNHTVDTFNTAHERNVSTQVEHHARLLHAQLDTLRNALWPSTLAANASFLTAMHENTSVLTNATIKAAAAQTMRILNYSAHWSDYVQLVLSNFTATERSLESSVAMAAKQLDQNVSGMQTAAQSVNLDIAQRHSTHMSTATKVSSQLALLHERIDEKVVHLRQVLEDGRSSTQLSFDRLEHQLTDDISANIRRTSSLVATLSRSQHDFARKQNEVLISLSSVQTSAASTVLEADILTEQKQRQLDELDDVLTTGLSDLVQATTAAGDSLDAILADASISRDISGTAYAVHASLQSMAEAYHDLERDQQIITANVSEHTSKLTDQRLANLLKLEQTAIDLSTYLAPSNFSAVFATDATCGQVAGLVCPPSIMTNIDTLLRALQALLSNGQVWTMREVLQHNTSQCTKTPSLVTLGALELHLESSCIKLVYHMIASKQTSDSWNLIPSSLLTPALDYRFLHDFTKGAIKQANATAWLHAHNVADFLTQLEDDLYNLELFLDDYANTLTVMRDSVASQNLQRPSESTGKSNSFEFFWLTVSGSIFLLSVVVMVISCRRLCAQSTATPAQQPLKRASQAGLSFSHQGSFSQRGSLSGERGSSFSHHGASFSQRGSTFTQRGSLGRRSSSFAQSLPQ